MKAESSAKEELEPAFNPVPLTLEDRYFRHSQVLLLAREAPPQVSLENPETQTRVETSEGSTTWENHRIHHSRVRDIAEVPEFA